MNWSITGDRPVYLQLIEQIERAIVAGEYGTGARLPSVRDLAAEAAVNPNTMQRALQELETRGLVNTQRTAGRTVTEDAARIAQLRRQLALRQATAILRAMRALGYEKPETLALLEGLEPSYADAADTTEAFTNNPASGAAISNAFADAPNAVAAASGAFTKPSDSSAKASSIPANAPPTPSHSTGRK